MKKHYLILLVSLSVFISCENTEIIPETGPQEEGESNMEDSEEMDRTDLIPYFTLKKGYADPESDNWLIIHNEDGELLDYQLFQSADTLIFEAPESEFMEIGRLSITQLKYSLVNNGASHFHLLHTFTDVGKGAIWDQTRNLEDSIVGKFGNNSFHNLSKLGKTKKNTTIQTNIVVKNIPNKIERYSLTSRGDYGGTGNQIPQYSDSLYIEAIDLYPDIKYLLSIEDGDGFLKYQFITPSNTSEDIALDYLDFNDYDKVLKIALPQQYSHLIADVTAYEERFHEGTPLLISHQASGGPSDSFARLGFINDYGSFVTFFTVNTLDNYRYTYETFHKIPDTIIVKEKPEFSILDDSINDFEFSIGIDYLRTSSTWTFSENHEDGYFIKNTQWYLNSPRGSDSKVGLLPNELLEKYPHLNLAKMEHNSTGFTIIGNNYEDVLNSRFNSQTIWYPEYEFVSFSN